MNNEVSTGIVLFTTRAQLSYYNIYLVESRGRGDSDIKMPGEVASQTFSKDTLRVTKSAKQLKHLEGRNNTFWFILVV